MILGELDTAFWAMLLILSGTPCADDVGLLPKLG